MIDPRARHALAYPFDPPDEPFVFAQGVAQAFSSATEGLIATRTPVLAVGSNGSPQRLAQKFGDQVVIPVTTAVVPDHVVAHSAKFSAYASVPATLHPWPGAMSRVLVTWLTDAMLQIMDRTEDLGVEYDRVGVMVDFSMAIPTADRTGSSKLVDAYVSLAGAFGDQNGPIVSAASRVDGADGLTHLDQKFIQTKAMELLDDKGPLERFILANVENDALRRERSKNISRTAGLQFLAGRS